MSLTPVAIQTEWSTGEYGSISCVTMCFLAQCGHFRLSSSEFETFELNPFWLLAGFLQSLDNSMAQARRPTKPKVRPARLEL